jgi:uncharacterized protein with HEPN domain
MPSTPSKPYAAALRDIAENIELARSFVAGLSFDEFQADRRTVYAVVRCLEIISEASRRLPVDLKARHPDIPWTDMAEREASIVTITRTSVMPSFGVRSSKA